MTDRRDPWPPLPDAEAFPVNAEDVAPHAIDHLTPGSRDPLAFATLTSAIIQIGHADVLAASATDPGTSFTDIVTAGTVIVGDGETWHVIAWGTYMAETETALPGFPEARMVIGSSNGTAAESLNEHPVSSGTDFPATLAPQHGANNVTASAVVKLQASAIAAGNWSSQYCAASFIAIRTA